MVRSLVSWCMAGLLGASAFGQSLVGKIPEDALVYAWFGGTDALEAQAKGSGLAGLMEAWKPQEKLAALLGPDGVAGSLLADSPIPWAQLQPFLATLGSRPLALYVGLSDRPEGVEGAGREPVVVLLCEAGAEADGLVKTLGGLVEGLEQGTGLRFGRSGGLLVVYSAGLDRKADHLALLGLGDAAAGVKPSRSLQAAGVLKAYEQDMLAEAGLGVFVNVGALLTADWPMPRTRYVRTFDDEGKFKSFELRTEDHGPKLREKFADAGFSAVKGAIYTARFREGLWEELGHVRMEKPAGLLKGVHDGLRAPSAEAFAVIPESVVSASVFGIDAGVVVRALLAERFRVSPVAKRRFEREMEGAVEELGFHPMDDLLASLGSEWVFFGEREIPSLAVVHKLRNAEKGAEVLTKLMSEAMKAEQGPMSVRTRDRKGVKTWYIALGLVQPTWGLVDGYLVAASGPSLFDRAVAQIREPKAAPGVLALFPGGEEGVKQGRSFGMGFARTQEAIVGFEQMLRSYYGLAMMGLGVRGAPPLDDVLPTREALQAAFAAPTSSRWTLDERGLTYRSSGPLPLSGLFAVNYAAPQALPVLLGAGALGMVAGEDVEGEWAPVEEGIIGPEDGAFVPVPEGMVRPGGLRE